MNIREFLSKGSIETWLTVLTLIAFVVRAVHLTSTDIAGDEPFSIFMSQFDVPYIISYLWSGNNPPLFEVLLHYYIGIFGKSEVSLRLLPTIFSSLTVVPLFLSGTRFFSRSVGFIASALLIFSTHQIRFAHEVRVYSLFSLLTAWSIYFFLSLSKDPARLGSWIRLFLVNSVLLYLHYLSIYVVVAQFVLALLFLPREWLIRLISLLLGYVMIYLPNLIVLLERIAHVVGDEGLWVPVPGWGEIYGSINLLLNGRTVTVTIIGTVLVSLILSKGSTIRNLMLGLRHRNPCIIGLLFAIPYLLQFFVSVLYIPMFIDRYILYTSLPLYLFIAWFLTELWEDEKGRMVGSLVPIAVFVAVADFNPPNHRNAKSAVAQIMNRKDDSTLVYICPNFFDITFAYHGNRSWFEELGSETEPRKGVEQVLQANGIYAIANADQLPDSTPVMAKKIIYLDVASEFSLPSNRIRETLQSNFHEVDSIHVHEIYDIYTFEVRL